MLLSGMFLLCDTLYSLIRVIGSRLFLLNGVVQLFPPDREWSTYIGCRMCSDLIHMAYTKKCD